MVDAPLGDITQDGRDRRVGPAVRYAGDCSSLGANGSFGVKSVQFPGQFYILGADTAGIVSGKVDGQAIVYVQPFGVMSHGFGRDGAAGHKAKSVYKIGKLVLPMKLAV
jgi:hypothetical protein